MAKHYNLIVWGMAFVFLNININQFDLLPDIIGYIMIMNAAIKLYNETDIHDFNIAGFMGIGCIIMEVVGFIGKVMWQYEPNTIMSLIIQVLSLLITLGLIFYIYEGTIRLLEQESTQLVLTLKSGQRFIVIVQFVLICSMTLTINVHGDIMTGIMTLGIIAGISTVIVWAVNMHSVKKYYENQQVNVQVGS